MGRYRESLDALRAEVLDYAKKKGVYRAAKQWGLNRATIRRWRAKYGRKSDARSAHSAARFNDSLRQQVAFSAAVSGVQKAADTFDVSVKFASRVRREFNYPALNRTYDKMDELEKIERLEEIKRIADFYKQESGQ